MSDCALEHPHRAEPRTATTTRTTTTDPPPPPKDEEDPRLHDYENDRIDRASGNSNDSEDLRVVREERNTFRDACLTLGAEVANLRNMLAAERSTLAYPTTTMGYPAATTTTTTTSPHPYYAAPYDPECMPPFFVQPVPPSHTLAAMSDAGIQHQSISEDGSEIMMPQGTTTTGGVDGGTGSKPWLPQPSAGGGNGGENNHILHLTGDGTLLSGSDGSVEHNNRRDGPLWSTPLFHGAQSRLSKDIRKFLQTISVQLAKQDVKRRSAVHRLTKMVTALWPRAQIKLYGSHVTNLCLPSSDLDFVICLPAVYNHNPADAPGVLEGRNAINETRQKSLARNLKGQSWLDPRSIKLIERTIVPVIKVSTKDTKAQVIQLDISFGGPEHHGLEAVQMITEVIQEFPMVRPLVLILKQFLSDRGLLTAYTGGLSSYCLFLMVAKYLQEQQSSLGDCGSLLMGFLDFFGNRFDPRLTGISVMRRQYFSRQNYDLVALSQQNHEPVWTSAADQCNGNFPPAGPLTNIDYMRRGNFAHDLCNEDSNNRGVGGMMTSKFGMKPPRIQNRRYSAYHNNLRSATPHENPNLVHSGRPFTFDPLFVEDPMSTGNNVGRNAFRIHQIKRAFSDAHRALVASLEWDISSNDIKDNSDYALLQCLLQSEDVFYEIDDPRF